MPRHIVGRVNLSNWLLQISKNSIGISRESKRKTKVTLYLTQVQ